MTLAASIGLLLSGNASAEDAPRIYREKVDPNWIQNADDATTALWYRVDLAADKRRFIYVDAESGERLPAFDHERVAAALGEALDASIEADKLPVESLSYGSDRSLVTLLGRRDSWELDTKFYTLRPSDGSAAERFLAPLPGPEPSRYDGPETQITFINRLKQPVDLFWLEPTGGRQPYGSVSAGGERELNTYVGNTWLVAKQSGDMIAVFRAREKRSVAEVGGVAHTPVQPRELPQPPEPDRARSPDGLWEVKLRGHDLILRDTESGEETQLTHDAHRGSSYRRNAEAARSIGMDYETPDPEQPTPEIYWSPDSRYFVAMRHTLGAQRKVAYVRSAPKDRLQPELEFIPYLKPGDAVPYAKPHLFNVAERREIPVSDARFENPWEIGDLRWRADSDEFVFSFNERGHQTLRLLGVNAQTGEVRTLVEERSETFINYSGKYFAEVLEDSHEIIWMSERDGWNHLYLYDMKTGQVKNQITRGEWPVRGVDKVDPEKRQIWFHASGRNSGEDPYHVHYYRIRFDGSGLTALTQGDGTHTVEHSPDWKYLVDTWSRVDLPPVSVLRRSEDGALVSRLEEADISEFEEAGWQPPERFTAKGRDGETDIYGLIYKPDNFDPEKHYPVVESIYASPHESFVPKSFSPRKLYDYLRELSFIVVKIDGMGTSNRSKAFHDVAWKNLKDAGLPDRILWMKAAARDRPWMDIERVGIFGGSAGGQSALGALLFHGDFYKAAVADCGCHDNRIDKIWWNEQWMGWPVDESYVRSSNVENAHKLQGKLLLMLGEMDKNVDPASTRQVAAALIAADKEFEYLEMPNMGHCISHLPYGRKRLIDFFQRALK